jgi:hypothetical protein
MKWTVWVFGLISGAILSLTMLLTLPFLSRIGFDRGEIIGYTTMVLAFLLVFFGIRSYRENVAGGSVSFGRALAVGSLIVVIASACYTATWEVIYFRLTPNWAEQYQAHEIEKARANGASQAVLDKKTAEGKRFAEMYKNPIVNVAVTMLEPLPVGLVIALVSAGVLARKRRRSVVAAPSIAAG